MFAISKDNKITGFIAEESQKEFLLENDPSLVFHPYEWTEERAPYISDFDIKDGALVRVATV